MILDLLLDLEKNPGARLYTDEEYDLGRFRVWLDNLGNPHHNQRFIHIAGTKGKGSTAAICEGLLRGAGFSTALYSSPHLAHFGERYRFNGTPWTLQEFEQRLQAFYDSLSPEQRIGIDKPHRYRTVFEVLTTLALTTFGQRARDLEDNNLHPQISIMETGLGGRLDCTNVIDPLVSIITVLGLDHLKILGDTIESIAAEKAGIIKKGRPTIVTRQTVAFSDHVWPVLIAQARKVGSPLIRAWDHNPVISATPIPTGQNVVLELPDGQPVEAHLPLHGEFQLLNLESALAACWYVAKEQNRPLTPEAIVKGLSLVSWPGRVEIHHGSNQSLILDGAHCPLSAAAFSRELLRLLESFPKNQKVTLLVGMQRDKQTRKFLEALITPAMRRHVVSALTFPIDSLRAADPADLVESFAGLLDNVSAASTLEEAMERGVATGANIALTGSLYALSNAREIWKRMNPGEATNG